MVNAGVWFSLVVILIGIEKLKLLKFQFKMKNYTNIIWISIIILFLLPTPGGRLLVLEFSKPTNEMLREIYDFYSFEIIPKLGEIVLSSEESYQYLAESIRMHPNQEELKDLFEECGFENCKYENLTNGIVAIHTGTKSKKQ